MTPNPLSFEAALQQLEACVSALEQGGLTLEEALTRFEEGMRLAAHCHSLLDTADLRVTQLLAATDADRAAESDAELPF
ncbi:MAG TPA: exodeoxyribonuclease VII small subunit [Chloroflexota bacterium]|jgi:exodeoxyribonuclease VII small subunit|nr:exodeoxyribonuclease VII small subunit [Chloroflexota bacterium]